MIYLKGKGDWGHLWDSPNIMYIQEVTSGPQLLNFWPTALKTLTVFLLPDPIFLTHRYNRKAHFNFVFTSYHQGPKNIRGSKVTYSQFAQLGYILDFQWIVKTSCSQTPAGNQPHILPAVPHNGSSWHAHKSSSHPLSWAAKNTSSGRVTQEGFGHPWVSTLPCQK